MTKSPLPYVSHLGVKNEGIALGTQKFFNFVDTVPSFRFESNDGSFTARKYKNYWNAYRKVRGVLRQEYLGKTNELTEKRLNDVARILAMDDVSYNQLLSERKRLGGKGHSKNGTKVAKVHPKRSNNARSVTLELTQSTVDEGCKTTSIKDEKVLALEKQVNDCQLHIAEIEKRIQRSTDLLNASLPLPANKGGAIKIKVKEALNLLLQK